MKMKFKTALIFLLISILGFSQTNRFIYELKYKNDSLQKEYSTQEMVLDINPKEVKFYEYGFLKNDSLSKLPEHLYYQWTSQTGQTLKRKRNTNLNSNYAQIRMMPFYYVIDTNDEMKWEIKKETKMLGDFKIQKATTNFGGRKWIAWFTNDIPISEGPYKFRGLPGLILQIQDSKANYIYSFSRNKNIPQTFDTSKFVENHYDMRPIKVDQKKWEKLNLEFYADPYSNMRTNFQPDWFVEINGRRIHKKEEFNELTKSTQEELKKYYNPIELDKAFHYPKN